MCRVLWSVWQIDYRWQHYSLLVEQSGKKIMFLVALDRSLPTWHCRRVQKKKKMFGAIAALLLEWGMVLLVDYWLAFHFTSQGVCMKALMSQACIIFYNHSPIPWWELSWLEVSSWPACSLISVSSMLQQLCDVCEQKVEDLRFSFAKVQVACSHSLLVALLIASEWNT